MSEAATSAEIRLARIGLRGRAIVAAFASAHFAQHVATSLLNPLLPLIRDAFALSYAESGFAVSAYSLSLGFSNAPMGVLADRFGSRRVIAVGLVLTGMASLAIGLAGSFAQLLVLLVVLGVVSGSYHAPAASLLARAFPAKVRGAAMGLHITGGHLSFFATPLVAAGLVAAIGTWRAPYLAFAVAPILAGVVVWALAPGDHEERIAGAGGPFALGEVIGVFRSVGAIVSISVLFQIIYAAIFSFLTLYLVDARGFSPPVAVTLFALPQLVGMGGAPLSGWLSDRLGRRAVIVLGVGILGPSLLLLTLVPNELILLPLAVIGLAAPMRATVTEVLMTETAPPARRGAVLGTYYTLAQPLGGVAAPLIGALAGAVGIATAFFLVTLAAAVLSIGVALARDRV